MQYGVSAFVLQQATSEQFTAIGNCPSWYRGVDEAPLVTCLICNSPESGALPLVYNKARSDRCGRTELIEVLRCTTAKPLAMTAATSGAYYHYTGQPRSLAIHDVVTVSMQANKDLG